MFIQELGRRNQDIVLRSQIIFRMTRFPTSRLGVTRWPQSQARRLPSAALHPTKIRPFRVTRKLRMPICVLSPAKSLDESSLSGIKTTEPNTSLASRRKELIDHCVKLKKDDLKKCEPFDDPFFSLTAQFSQAHEHLRCPRQFESQPLL